jgi:hypothetical protein
VRQLRRRVEVVPTAPVVVSPGYVPTASQRRVVRGLLSRRTRRVETVPAQVVATPPDYVPQPTVRRALRGLASRRGRRPEVVQTQQAAPANPVLAPQATQRRTLRGIVRRRGQARPLWDSQRVPTTAVRRVRGAQTRRRQPVQPVPATAAAGVLRYVPQPTRRRVRLVVRRGRNAFQFVHEGLAQLFGTAELYPRDNPSAEDYPHAGPTAGAASQGGPTAELYDRDGPTAERS